MGGGGGAMPPPPPLATLMVESSEIHILLKIKLELIDYILIDYESYFIKFSTVMSQGSKINLCNGL